MSEVALPLRRRGSRLSAGQLGVLAILLAAAAVSILRDYLPWLMSWPKGWEIPLKKWVGDGMKWLINDADLGFFTFKELTRSIAWVLEWPLLFARGVLSEGFQIGGLSLPPISWFALIALSVWGAFRLKDRALSILVLSCLFYLALFGRWEGAMITLSSIVVAVPLGAAGGLLIGLWAHRSERLEKLITPFLDFMQTVPIFAYLVPVLFFFGFGPVSAMVSTIIFAMPPMVRITMLALRQVPPEVVEFGRMAGCTRRQMNWKVLVPAASGGLMIGVNQVIMMSLNMVIIAAMIGAGGLGHEVLTAMRALKLGAAFEASLAIALMAIVIDRLSQAAASRRRPSVALSADGRLRRHRLSVMALAFVVACGLLGWLWPAIQVYPEGGQVSVAGWLDDAISYLNKTYFDDLEAIKNFFLLNLMKPTKLFLVEDVPWSGALALLAFVGWRLGGWRLSAIVTALLSYVIVTGLWEPAMISTYLCVTGVVLACLIGVPLGVLAAKSELANKIIQPAIDTLQTLPAFAYLIPAVMFFQNGDFTALLAIVAFAVVAPIRFTAHGLRQVPPALVEAAITSGCTPRQRLFKVELPVALPEILLGINQTIMLALSMLVITALVGTRDLGQEVYAALAKADVGRGLVSGAGVACLAIIADRLMQAWVREKKRKMGLTQ